MINLESPMLTAGSAVNKKDPLVLLGLDVSPKHCGFAVSDSKRVAVKALFSVRWKKKDYKKFLYQIADVVKEYKVGAIIIGLPVNVYDVLPQSKQYITTLGHNLKQITGLPYFFQNEHLSTVMSRGIARGTNPEKVVQERLNEISAAYILQSFIEENRKIKETN